VADHITGISLRDVRKLLDDKSVSEKAIDAVDQLIGAALVISPLVVGIPLGLILQSLLAPKDQIVTICKNVVAAISKSDARDYQDQATNLAAAHCLITFTAYFDALPDLAKELKLTGKEKQHITSAAVAGPAGGDPAMRPGDLSDLVVAVPHPAGPEAASEIRRTLYHEMSRGLARFLAQGDERGRWDYVSEERFARLLTQIREQVPVAAERLYRAELTGLAIDFPQFFTWLVLADQDAKDALIRKIGTDTQVRFELVGRAMDLGLRGLADDMAQLRRAMAELSQAELGPPGAARDPGGIAAALHEIYAYQIDQPVIDDRHQPERGPKLGYPSRARSYVPQAYRLVGDADAKTHLERDDAWADRPVHDDLGPFLLRYLESAYATQGPLLVLGHAGSGKSLLTQVLATRLAYPAYTTVRVELRDADPAADIQRQIEAQIRKDTGEDVSWPAFARTLPSPPVVIIDGYDELLQATGALHADYLDRVRLFQDREAALRRPVRMMVTSRITLIDMVTIPPGTTIVRLEEFDEERRNAWAEVWNAHNSGYFAQAGVRPFALPASDSLAELAKQPLLLFMLAIYDASANQLSTERDMDQTRLYYTLLSRFVEHELDKDAGFRQLPVGHQEEQIDRELARLGVAAIGMFNRQRLVIRREELDADLRLFEAGPDKPAAGTRPLTQADLLLGSFFFIHESRSSAGREPGSPGGPASFEFLHKTFAEFLTADFILRQLTAEAEEVAQLTGRPGLSDALRRHLEHLPETWFGCLIHTPLHTQPNVLALLRGWADHRLAEGTRSRTDLLAALDTIILTQLRTLLTATSLPALAAQGRDAPYAPLPALGHLAIYSLNLITLRSYLSDDPYVLDEADLGEQPAGCRAWDRLTAIWRSWFPAASLSALAYQLTAIRRESRIVIAPWPSQLFMSAGTALSEAYLASLALADDLTATSLGLHLAALRSTRAGYLGELRDRMQAEVPELIPVADFGLSRTSRLPVAQLPAFSHEYWHPGILDRRHIPSGDLPAGRELEFVELTDRLALSPGRWADLGIPPAQMRRFVLLSRYAAEVTVHSADTWEPLWLLNLFRANSPTAWARLLRGPAGAPVLRAALRRLDQAECAVVARGMEAVLPRDSDVPFDVDTAASVALIAWRGGFPGLAARSLGWIIGACRRGTWRLLDIPAQLWSDLADMLVSADANVTPRRRELAELLIAEAEHADMWASADWYAKVDFMIHTLRICGVRDRGAFRADIVADLDHPLVPRATRRRWFLLLIRWAHEYGDREFIGKLFPGAISVPGPDDPSGRHLWRELLGLPPGRPLDAEAIQTISVDLTHREAADLRWALGVLLEHRS
jgi:NACHT conflict system protein